MRVLRGVGAAVILLLATVMPSAAGGAPAISFSPTEFDFGSLAPGETATQVFTLRNTGGKATAVLSIGLTGSSAFQVIANTCTGHSLGPAKTCQVTVRFTAPASGSVSGLLTATGKKLVTASATLAGAGVNRAPDAVDDVVLNAFYNDPPFDWGWLDNDSDPDIGDTFTVTAIGGTPVGLVSIVDGGAGIEYDPNGEFDGLATGFDAYSNTATDSFTYTITDSHGVSDTATVSLTIHGLGVDFTALCIPLTLSAATASPLDSLTVSGTAADGGFSVVIVLDNTTVLAQTTSDPTNHFFSTSVTVPAGLNPGPHSLQAFALGNEAQPIVGCPASVAGFTVV